MCDNHSEFSPFIIYGETELSQHSKGRCIKNVTLAWSRYSSDPSHIAKRLNATVISEVAFSYWNSKTSPAENSFVHNISFYDKNLKVSTRIWATHVSYPGPPLDENRFRLKEAKQCHWLIRKLKDVKPNVTKVHWLWNQLSRFNNRFLNFRNYCMKNGNHHTIMKKCHSRFEIIYREWKTLMQDQKLH